MQSAATRMIPAKVFSMCYVPVDQALDENGSRIEAWLPWVDWNSALVPVAAPVIVLPRHVRRTPRRRRGYSTTVIATESVIILLAVSVLISSVSTSLTPRGRSWAVSRLDCVCNHGSAMDPIPRLRYGCILFSRRPEQSSDLHQTLASF